MKWLLVFFVGMVSEQEANLYGFPDLLFRSEKECKIFVYNFYQELQLTLNYEYDTFGVQYPPICITQEQFYKIVGKST